MNTEAWMEKALISIEKLETGTSFVLKDLFNGAQWNQLAKGDRLYFGRFFKNKAIGGLIPNIKYVGKAPNNSAVYIKI